MAFICADHAELAAILASEAGIVPLGGGLRVENATFMQVFTAPETGLWAVVETSADGWACIVASGEGWETETPLAKGQPL